MGLSTPRVDTLECCWRVGRFFCKYITYAIQPPRLISEVRQFFISKVERREEIGGWTARGGEPDRGAGCTRLDVAVAIAWPEIRVWCALLTPVTQELQVKD